MSKGIVLNIVGQEDWYSGSRIGLCSEFVASDVSHFNSEMTGFSDEARGAYLGFVLDGMFERRGLGGDDLEIRKSYDENLLRMRDSGTRVFFNGLGDARLGEGKAFRVYSRFLGWKNEKDARRLIGGHYLFNDLSEPVGMIGSLIELKTGDKCVGSLGSLF
ncbi:hypothetical protein HN903_00090 [archaeon]|jgi:hypothetical protein|nr:hypothetical protein [archaeon]MBT7128136.1 hypothetical protein [archaeon]